MIAVDVRERFDSIVYPVLVIIDECFRQIGKRFTTVPIAVAVAVDERFLAERRRQHRDEAVHRAWILYIQQDRTNAFFGGRIRSEESRGGEGSVSTCQGRGAL